MPSIERGNITNAEWRNKIQSNRFVRLGNTFYYDDDSRVPHSQIATDNGAQTGKFPPNRPQVDDGGEIVFIGSKIAFSSATSSCDIKGNKLTARKESHRIAALQFGEENVHPY